MNQSLAGIGEIKTQPLYYYPLKFEHYEIEKVLSDNHGDFYDGLDDEVRQSFQDFDDERRSFYIVGKGKYAHAAKDTRSVVSYEKFIQSEIEVNNASFLEDMLSVGYGLLGENGHSRKDVTDNESIDLILGLINKYGLNEEELFSVKPRGSESVTRKIGCNLWNFARGLQWLGITHQRMLKLRDKEFADDSKFNIEATVSSCSATIISRCLYSDEKGCFKTVLCANSLLDIAQYQLSKVMSDGAYTRKCANPACSRVIVGGRSDKRTCSDSCRKALERYQKAK